MKRNKKLMRIALRTAVEAVFHQYRVGSHRARDRAIDDVCCELQRMKHENAHRCTLLTESEFLRSVKRPLLKRIFGVRG